MDATVLAVAAGVGLLAAVVGIVLWRRRRAAADTEDTYARALEAWLGGDTATARRLLQELVRRRPDTFAPYLQLGVLLREAGDPGRAAALHRGLILRRDLDPSRKHTARLALVEDLLAGERWDEAAAVLDELGPVAGQSERYWRLLFRQRLGAGDAAAAAEALKQAARRGPREVRDRFRREYALFQLDRALAALRDGDPRAARRLAHPWRKDPDLAPWPAYVEATADEATGDHAKAVEAATRGMHDAPAWAALFLPVLQSSLLATGRYERVVPILESASRDPAAPPSLWIAQAMLHEKVGQREQAVRLLVEKAGDPRLTPALAAPLLRILVRDLPDCDFTRVWSALHLPRELLRWQCEACGHVLEEIHLCCPHCRAVGRIRPLSGPGEGT